VSVIDKRIGDIDEIILTREKMKYLDKKNENVKTLKRQM
jgi:hypothetical protein